MTLYALDDDVQKLARRMGQDVGELQSRVSEIPSELVAPEDLLPLAEAALDPSLLVEGTFAPTLGFATPGTSTIAHSVQTGRFQKIGNRVVFAASVTATITKGTASGRFRLSFNDLPYVPVGALGVGVLRLKPGQINMTAGAVGLVPQVLTGVRAVEFATFTLEAGTAVYIGAPDVEDGAMTLTLRGEYWV